MIRIELAAQPEQGGITAILLTSQQPDYTAFQISEPEQQIISRFREAKKQLIPLYNGNRNLYVQTIESKEPAYKNLEAARKAGANLAAELRSMKISEIALKTDSGADILLAYAEGLALGSYQFEKYKTEKFDKPLAAIYLSGSNVTKELARELQTLVEANFLARNLVNEPGNCLTAEKLGKVVKQAGQALNFKTEVFNKAKIQALKMGGLLAVNAGSQDPPSFSILEYKPDNAINTKPIVFAGKGVVFDTGGLTLKPTPGSMDLMKSDMAGAAAVIALFHAVAKEKLPIYIVGLIPSTDNRPGEMATFPGDIITMYDGTTVEVLNTDAEGRLILGDALAYAKKYEPELVIDLATLTGAASRTIGPYGIIYMGTASEEVKNNLEQSGNQTYERLVELPLWEEYAELIKTDIADLKNVSSGGTAGAITAGKFLEHFTDYPWLHLDIAPVAFLTGPDSYRGKNATGIGVRLLYDFLKNRLNQS